MKILILLLSLIGCQATYYNSVQKDWENFKIKYSKHYTTKIEEAFRMKIFAENKHRIDLHNQKYTQNLVKFETGINQFSDLLHQEFIDQTRCYKFSQHPEAAGTLPEDGGKLPDNWDWRDQNIVSPVKNQSTCGACYSFTSTGVIESQHRRRTGKTITLSEQNLIDCARNYGTQGCNGGDEIMAFKYILANGGIDTEESYPYENSDTFECRYNPENSGTTISGYMQIYPGDEDKLKLAVVTIGPMAVGFDSQHETFKNFKGTGIFYEPECLNDVDHLTHSVLVIGYGTNEEGEDYWIVKNSWGTDWGDEGFFKLARNKDNHCGVATVINYAII